MQHSRPHVESPLKASSTPTHIDNAKSLTSSMMDSQGRLFADVSGPSRSPLPPARDREVPPRHHTSPRREIHDRHAFPAAGDREPLLGHPSLGEPYHDSRTGLAVKPRRKKTGRFGLPVIVLCRVFSTIFAACTVEKARTDVSPGWDTRINKLVVDFCWIILVWNIFAFAVSIVSCAFFPASSGRRVVAGPVARPGRTARSCRDKLHAQFAINDAVLAVITLVLLMIACHVRKNPKDGRLNPGVVEMVSCLVAIEFLIVMIQPFQFSEKMLFSIC